MFVYSFVGGAMLLRLITLGISVKHERLLKANGAIEYGAANSRVLALLHLSIYVSAALEGAHHGNSFGRLNVLGLGLYLAGMAMLFAVIRVLGRLWTVKLLIARDHTLVKHRLFKHFRHPNYYFNIIPELIGLCLAVHATMTISLLLPMYLVSLFIRIHQEERIMKKHFPDYATD